IQGIDRLLHEGGRLGEGGVGVRWAVTAPGVALRAVAAGALAEHGDLRGRTCPREAVTRDGVWKRDGAPPPRAGLTFRKTGARSLAEADQRVSEGVLTLVLRRRDGAR